MTTTRTKTDKLDELHHRLTAQVESLISGEDWKAMLTVASRFHRYSARNAMLIQAQRPEATLVAGMRRWNELGYTIRKGEKALWVLAPMAKKAVDPETGEVVEDLVGFRPVPVFDASQLDGLEEKPLPSPRPVLPDDAEALYLQVKSRVQATGIRVLEDILPEGIDGVSRGGTILVKGRLGSRDRVLVLLHELAHELQHKGGAREGTTPQQRELEAEAAAFVVAAALGLDHPGARDYLGGWKVTTEQLRASLSVIQGLVRRVLAVVGEPERTSELRPAA